MADLKWKARWIGYAQHPESDLGVFKFRKSFTATHEQTLPIKVTADQRYRLFVNGQFVGEGPQRGDLMHWHFESYDLAPFLHDGDNTVEAVVWSFGRYAPMAQHTYRLAFVLDGPGLSTPDGWEVARVKGHDFEMMHNEVGGFYIDIGPGEIVNVPESELEWKKPNSIVHVLERGEWAGDSPWSLSPRSIPMMRHDSWKGQAMLVDRSSNERKPFASVMVHPGEKTLLDFGELLAAYPQLSFDGEAGTTIKITYGEGLFDAQGRKMDRNDVRGKSIKGYQDKFVLGNGHREVAASTLWWRTWRYIQIESDRPVRLSKCDALVTGYPYSVESSFVADDPWVEKIWDVGVRTARLCAGETYFDCPYYEQLQYVGDTRIQTLIHYYLSRDRSLPRNAVEQFSWSMLPNGLTQSRYPSRVMQIIPPFSLFWVLMLRDQMLYDHQHPKSTQWADKVLQNFPEANDPEAFWFFFDWVEDWPMGIPKDGIVHACRNLLKLLAQAARDRLLVEGASDWVEKARAHELQHQFFTQDWPKVLKQLNKQRLPNKLMFEPASEHLEALCAVLHRDAGVEPPPWPDEALKNANASECTYYFQYYKHQAMQPEDYMSMLEPWKDMIRNGLTTFAEAPEPTRSDCHAWSAHPLLGFFQIIAGVTSDGPEWKHTRIAPKPGSLKHFEAKIAHPMGDLQVQWDGNSFEVDSPVPYDFLWKGKTQKVKPGRSRF